MATAPKKVSQIDKAIAQRLKDYWGAFLRQVRHLNIETDLNLVLSRAEAPVEHTFNNHACCDDRWCYVLKAKQYTICAATELPILRQKKTRNNISAVT